MRTAFAAAALAALCVGPALSQAPAVAPSQGYKTVAGPHTLNPGEWPAHYPFADETEAAVSAPEVHHVRYIDSHVRLVEVGYFPGVQGNVHGHPFPSVFAVDGPVPNATNIPIDPTRNMVQAASAAPDGASYPLCRAATPQMLHHETNLDTFPHHFFRLEFQRVDGPTAQDKWQSLYPRPLAGSARDRLLYEDDHARLIEVLVRPGETRAAQTSPYPAVLATDIAQTLPATPKGGHKSPVLKDFETMQCATVPAGRTPALHNTGKAPIHYYRIEFKRIDGDGLKDHWREWYPWLATLKEAYDRSPNTPNF